MLSHMSVGLRMNIVKPMLMVQLQRPRRDKDDVYLVRASEPFSSLPRRRGRGVIQTPHYHEVEHINPIEDLIMIDIKPG